MAVNIFEGARRISVSIQVLWVVAALSIGIFNTPYVSLYYISYSPSDPLKLSNVEECNVYDAKEYVSQNDSDGDKIHVTLCFKASAFEGGNMLIPYKVDEKNSNKVWGKDKYSAEVVNYIASRTRLFLMSQQAENDSSRKWRQEKWNSIKVGIKVASIGYVIILIFTYGMGWIVRGFRGIPQGQDSKTSTGSEED
jgi:hypothetical protein